ncbi:MAG TPA: hypothetical protein VN081_05595 [Dongiaceae bacterium]|nr:hypothetical protein [Dongiaceae bacterium]HWU24204.1 hypothetical protein [Candidatus Paceibacterota bacterium]
MARLTDHDYLKNHELLRTNRAADNTAFVMLDPSEQWDLFSYYLPHEVRGYPALLGHRAEVSRLDPSLPQRAGRAFQKFLINRENLSAYRTYAASKPRTKKNAPKQIYVFSEVKPELDPKRFVDIILRAAREQRERDASRD